MQFDKPSVQALANELAKLGMFPLASDFHALAADVAKRAANRTASGNDFSITRAIRGLTALRGAVVNPKTQSEDIQYAQRVLNTSDTPGSYLVPTIQAGEMIGMLSIGGLARSAGIRIWPLEGIQKLTVSVAATAPTIEWIGQNSEQSASDAVPGQISFDLRSRRALAVVPNELLTRSTPAFDAFLTEVLVQAYAEHEDNFIFRASAASGGPTPIYAASNTTTHLVGETANGGTMAYADLLRTVRKAYAAKANGPFAWFMSPRTFFDRVCGLEDTEGHLIVHPDATAPFGFRLLGSPVFVSPEIPENLANGSGTNQSYILFTNPKYLHLAQSGGIEISVSTERYFEKNQTGIRVTQGVDLAVAPAAGVILLKGVN